MTLFKGVGVAMVTPFGNDGGIDYGVLKEYVEHLISGGASALIPFGTTGEPATVTAAEYEKATAFIIKQVNKRVPVIVGAGSNNTALAYDHALTAKRLGADGVLVVTPYYNKCTQNGIIEHYKAVAKAGIPVIAYNVPSRTGVNIAPATVRRLAEINGVVGIKEANGNMDHFMQVAKICGEVGLDMYSGEDGLTAVAIMLGCKGVISVAANPAPKQMAELCNLCFNGDYQKAVQLQFKLQELIDSLFCEVNPIPAKKAMQLLGFEVGTPRLPLTEMEKDHTERLKAAMCELGLIA